VTTFVQYLIDAFNLASTDALVALGIALVFGIMQLVNFAHGEIIMLGAYALFYLLGVPLPIVILGTLAAAAVVALAMERIAFRPVRGSNPTTLLVTSFAVSYLLQNTVISTIGNFPKTPVLPQFLGESFSIGDILIQKVQVITVGTTVVLVVALALFFKRTTIGRQMRAAAEDFRMARLLGIHANRVIATAFVISGLLAGVVSFLLVAQTDLLTPQMGVAPVLVGFVATVIGGMGSLVGAALGGFLLGFVTVAFQNWLPLELRPFRDAFAFGLVIAILVFRPQGILGAEKARV
jgi:branched-chain amino acid transport system permease protein